MRGEPGKEQVALREDGLTGAIDAFQRLDDFVPQCSVWTMGLTLDGRELAACREFGRMETMPFEVEVTLKEHGCSGSAPQ